MIKKTSIKKNIIYQIFYELLIMILPLITSPYVSRILGADNIGKYSYTYTIVNYFVLFAALGIKNYGNREISRIRDNQNELNKTFTGILYLHFIISGIVIVAYGIYIFIVAKEEFLIYSCIQGLYIIAAFFDISWLFFGLEQFKITVLRNTFIRMVSALAIFLFVKEIDDLWIYIFILALGNLFGQLYLWKYVKEYVQICKIETKEVLKHLPQMSLLFIPTIAVSLYIYMDKIMIGSMSGTKQLGFYENSEKIINIATSIVCSVGTVMLPRMSNIIARGEKEKSLKYIKYSMEIVLCVSCAMAFGLASISNIFAPVFWGDNFQECSVLIALLGVTLPVKGYANVLRTQYLIPNAYDREYILSVCIGAVLNIGVNFTLIPKYQAVGAAIGTIIAECSVCIVQIYFCRKELPIFTYLKNGIPYLVIGTVMYGINYKIAEYMNSDIITLVIQIIVGVFTFSMLCLCYFVFSKNELFYKVVIEKIKGK